LRTLTNSITIANEKIIIPKTTYVYFLTIKIPII